MNKSIRKIVRETLNEYMTTKDLMAVEDYVDDLFSDLNVDVHFSQHFKDRVNDPRNKKDIEPIEIEMAFEKAKEDYGDDISNMNDDEEAVITDVDTDLNIPFHIDREDDNIDLKTKTIMRKRDFKSTTPKLKV